MQTGATKRGSSPTLREGSATLPNTPSLTIVLLPRFDTTKIVAASETKTLIVKSKRQENDLKFEV